jgi:hypothetical protein
MAEEEMEDIFTLQCWPLCIIWTSNSAHVAGFGHCTVTDAFKVTLNLKTPLFRAGVGI